MENTERIFVSIGLPAAARESLVSLQQPLTDVAWGGPEQFHITMRFLGDVALALADGIEEKLADIKVEPFLLPLGGVGRFPPRGPMKVLWAGVGNGHPRLHQLRKKIDDAALAAGWRGELRNFDPHITLGRVQAGAETKAIDQWLSQYREFQGPIFRVEEFYLMSSTLRPGGAVHAVKRCFKL